MMSYLPINSAILDRSFIDMSGGCRYEKRIEVYLSR